MAGAGSVAELVRMLAARMEHLAPELLPAARREGNLLRVGSIDGEAGKSLAVYLRGPRAGHWTDYASGEHGDALDLVRATRHCTTREALAWARGWLGLAERGEPSPASTRQVAGAPQPPPDDDYRRRAALRIWLAAEPALRATPADAYLRRRGIDLSELGRQPRALRFHHRLWSRECGAHLPALVAAVSRGGEFRGIHRTFLAKTPEGAWAKAALASPKLSLGAIAGAVIPLQRGASGKPLRAAPEGETAVIGEGIETCLSIAIACPELRVLCGVSLGNLAAIDLPAAITTVILAADNDPGRGPQKLLRRAARRFIDQGRVVRIARSPVGSDFNDCLNKGVRT